MLKSKIYIVITFLGTIVGIQLVSPSWIAKTNKDTSLQVISKYLSETSISETPLERSTWTESTT